MGKRVNRLSKIKDDSMIAEGKIAEFKQKGIFVNNKDGGRIVNPDYIDLLEWQMNLMAERVRVEHQPDHGILEDRTLPLSHSEWVITKWYEDSRNCVTTLPDRDSIQGRNPPPLIHGGVFGSQQYMGTTIRIDYGIEINTPGKGALVDLKSCVDGFVHVGCFCDADDPHCMGRIEGKLNLFLTLYRGVERNLYEFNDPSCYHEWYFGMHCSHWAKSYTPDQHGDIAEDFGYYDQGYHFMSPVERSLQVKLPDLRRGDKLVMGMLFSLSAKNSFVLLGQNQIGGIKFNSPVVRELL